MNQAECKTISLLERLVGFDTTSHLSNLSLVEFVSDYLRGFDIYPLVELDGDGRKANLFATIGPRDKPGVVLSGHTDVVPVAGQDWSHDPFALKVSGGKAFGRGACDMKGFLACVLAAVPDLVAAKLDRPVHIAFSYDEEIGCVGVRSLLPQVRKMTCADTLVIVGEPTGMQPVAAHKGKQVLKCRFTGTPMHSSQVTKGVSAIAFAGELLHTINRIARDLPESSVNDGWFAQAQPTINFGRICGGSAVNVVPEHCEFDVEYRYPPGLSADEFIAFVRQEVEGRIQGEMAKISAFGMAEVDTVTSYPAFANSAESQSVKLVTALSGANELGAAEFGTEAGLFSEAGFDTVVFGPGSIDQAHQPDEFIKLSELEKCDRFLCRLREEFSATGRTS